MSTTESLNNNNLDLNFQVIFENSNDGILIYDFNQDMVISVNSRCLEILDRKKEEVLHKTPNSFLVKEKSIDKESLNRVNTVLEKAKTEGKGQFQRKHIRRDGKASWLEVSVYYMRPPQEHLLVTVYRDITELKEQQILIESQNHVLKTKNLELEKYVQSNSDLENFAFMAAHDLQSPINTMVGFSKILQKSIADNDFEEAAEFAKFIQDASENMSDLVKDLLDFSRINTSKLNIENFNPRGLLTGIILGLDSVIQERNAEIVVRDLPTSVAADKVKIRQLFQNLITNGLKFQKPSSVPKIIISIKDLENDWEFEVKDNGIGIEEKNYRKVFKLFQRLNSKKKFKGTGIGLAMCKKIIEQHRGSIRVESKLGVGTSFIFSLPKS